MRTWTSRFIALSLVLAGCTGRVGEPDDSNPPRPGVTCDPGFELVAGACQDIDECSTTSVGCDINAACVNQPGSFSCVCNDGFSGDGTTCTAEPDRCDDFAAILSAPANNCTTCHDTTPGVEGGDLDLVSANAGALMLNRRSGNTKCRDELLIDAAQPQNSLILKLVDPVRYAAWGDDACIGSMPFNGNGVSSADVACFEQWVQDVVDNNEAPPPPAVTPFEPMPAASALSKIKMILHGGSVTNGELATASQANGVLNREGLRTVITDWSTTPAFQNKMRAFLELSLQQDEINPRNQPYRDQLDPIGGSDNEINTQLLFPSFEQSFVRTALNIVQSGGDFRQVVTTRRWQVTTAILAALVYADRSRNPVRFERLAHLTEADYRDWRNVTFVQAANADEVPQFENNAAFVASLRSIGNNGSINLRAPRVGFFSTPTFYESWETNEDNQFRVTTNQAVLAALDILFEAGDTTSQDNLNGLNEDHSDPSSACYQCHRMLDPMRLSFQNIYNYKYRVVNNPETELQPSFAFKGTTRALAPWMSLRRLSSTTRASRPLGFKSSACGRIRSAAWKTTLSFCGSPQPFPKIGTSWRCWSICSARRWLQAHRSPKRTTIVSSS
ncbi:MAG: calcium-binding EGF-like domain-containing protein [Myxococcota bacterium]